MAIYTNRSKGSMQSLWNSAVVENWRLSFLSCHIDGLKQDYSITIGNALELLQSCTKTSILVITSSSCRQPMILEPLNSPTHSGSIKRLTAILPRGLCLRKIKVTHLDRGLIRVRSWMVYVVCLAMLFCKTNTYAHSWWSTCLWTFMVFNRADRPKKLKCC